MFGKLQLGSEFRVRAWLKKVRLAVEDAGENVEQGFAVKRLGKRALESVQ
jgi:hypothetical protein